MAKWMPSSSRPGIGRSRGFSAPPDSATASYWPTSSSIETSRADMDVVVEGDAFGLHLGDAAVDEALLQLEVGDAVAHQAAGLWRSSRRRCTSWPARASCCAQARPAGPEPIDGDRLAGLARIDLRGDPALFPALVDDGAFDRLDGHRGVRDVERAARLAGRRADAAGELGEVVGRVQVLERLQPVALVDEVVPVRDLVVHRAAVVTVGDAAIHAARRLVAGALVAQRDDELVVVASAARRPVVVAVAAVDLEEASDLAHDVLLLRRHLRSRLFLFELGESPAIFDRHHLAELGQVGVPVRRGCAGRAPSR